MYIYIYILKRLVKVFTVTCISLLVTNMMHICRLKGREREFEFLIIITSTGHVNLVLSMLQDEVHCRAQ